jgi:tetratricopeptide (TPR) repeat protein
VFRITGLIILYICFSYGQPAELKPARLSTEKEAWLAKDIEGTIRECLIKVASDSGNAILYYNLGYLHYLKKEISKALSYFQTARKKNESYPYHYLMTGIIYKEDGNLLGAKGLFTRGLEYDKNNYHLLMELADIYHLLNNDSLAAVTYFKVIDQHKDRIEPRCKIAPILRKMKKYKELKSILEPEDETLFPESSLLVEKINLYRELNDSTKVSQLFKELCSHYFYLEKLETFKNKLIAQYHLQQINASSDKTIFNYKIDPSEKLDYKVKYGFITLGWLKIRIHDTLIINGRKVYHLIFYVDSNPAFNFLISLHSIYESYIDAETLNSLQTRLYTPSHEVYFSSMYYFDYKKNHFRAQIINKDGRFESVEKDLPSGAQDGTSLLFFARGLVSNKISGTTAVVIDEQYKYAHINFLNETEKMDIQGEEIDALKIYARADFNGVAGMNGDAWGWFSPDKNMVPVIGKIKIIVGSITVKLED